MASQKHLSLKSRLLLAKKQFPDLKLSYSQLRLFYLHHGVKYKVMLATKYHSTIEKERIIEQKQKCFRELLDQKRQNKQIIYLDETVFQPFSVIKKAWAPKHENQMLFKNSKTIHTIAACVCISGEKGIITYILRKSSIRAVELFKLFEEMNKVMRRQRVTIFMDNLRSHHSKLVMNKLRELRWDQIYNASYSPEYHCIEQIFSIIKARYKQEIISRDFQISNKDHLNIIKRCIESVEVSCVKKTEESHLKKMKRFLNEMQL